MKKDIFIITGTEIYSKDKSITFRFMFDSGISGIEFERIKEYEKYGIIKKNKNGQWFMTGGNSEGMVFSGGIRCIGEEFFADTVYLMKESEYHEFVRLYDISHEVFHSKKLLFQS